MSKLLKFSLGFSLFAVVLLLGVSYYFSSLVLYPNVQCRSDHHVFCTDPSELGLSFLSVSIPTEDGLSLESYWIPAPDAKKALVLVHGHGGQRNEGLRFSKALHSAGYSLLLLSLRRNHGSFASMGFYEVKDVKAGVNFLEAKGFEQIGILGFSMGAATSILAMEKDPRIQAGLFSSGYRDAMEVLIESANRDFGIPYYPLIPAVKWMLNLRGDMDIDQVKPIQAIGNLSPRPILIFHCEFDDYVDSHHGRDLFQAAKEPKGIWTPACTRHERIWNQFPKEAETRSVEFFNKAFVTKP